ncbi:integral membrane protein [Patulibacter medicamentivorans]|uniref:Integral membrane protein n=1 Tax=Patulibacter medicamentivorans TaxID=1097667 RepID=H0E1C4_9ACTN|nr:integral membrane protein [Patulibacter medicamentivorans]
MSALADGLAAAQDRVLRPLSGLGTDLSLARPVGSASGEAPSIADRRRLREENEAARVALDDLGEPGDRFRRTAFVSSARLGFDDRDVQAAASAPDVREAAGSLTLDAIDVSGEVPASAGSGTPGAQTLRAAGLEGVDIASSTVTGVDTTHPALATVGPDQVTDGRWLARGAHREVVLDLAVARRRGLRVGSTCPIGTRHYEVVGLVSAPLGAERSDAYLPLSELQAIADRPGTVTEIRVRADRSDDVGALRTRLETDLPGTTATTAADLAANVDGSLADADDLVERLGTALVLLALAAAFVLTALITLGSVGKRTRELGTLRAIGWSRARLVRQLAGESLLQGVLGGLLGVATGLAVACAISRAGIVLRASVAPSEHPVGGGLAGLAGFGRGAVEPTSAAVTLTAPVDGGVLLVGLGLAVLAGLLAGAVGAARAARLRPADALRQID